MQGTTTVAAPRPAIVRPLWRSRSKLLGGAIAAGLLVWVLMRGRPMSAGYVDVALLWVVSVVCVVLAAGPYAWVPPRLWPARLASWVSARRVEVAAAGGIVVAALLLRAVALDLYPYSFGGDEGSLAVPALDVLAGKLTNPFGTGWYSTPTLFMFMQAVSIRLFGETVVGVRMLSALSGALAVACTYLLVRHLMGRWAALVAALLLAVFHYHIHFSRLASSQVLDTLFVVLAIYFLDRGVLERRRLDCVLAGLALGFSQYFYWGARIIPLLAVAYLGFLLWRGEGGLLATVRRREAWQEVARLGGWIFLSAILVFLPLLAFYADHPSEFYARINQVSIFSSGWLQKAETFFGKGPVELIAYQIGRAVLLPFQTIPSGWYLGGVPLVGAPLAVLTAFGLALATVGVFRREFFGIVVAYWAAAIGLGLTEDPTQTQRFIIAAPLLTIFAAVGLIALARIAVRLLAVPRLAAGAGVGIILLLISVWNVQHFFSATNPAERYGGENTLVATELAYYLRDLGGQQTVYFSGPPRMWYYGFQTLPYIARDARGVDVERPWTAASQSPALAGPTAFVFLPERVGELQTVRDLFPNGTVREVRSPPHEGPERLLFTSYEVRPG